MKIRHWVLLVSLCTVPLYGAAAKDAATAPVPATDAGANGAPMVPPPLPPTATAPGAPAIGSAQPVATPPMPPPPPPMMADAASAEPVDPKNLEVAEEIVKGFDLKEQLQTALSAMTMPMVPFLTQENPGQEEKLQKIATEAVQKIVSAHLDEIEKNKATVYAQLFTLSELEDLKKFYASTTGHKMMELTPEMMRRDAMLSQNVMMTSITDVRKEMAAKIQKAGLKVPKGMVMP